MLCYCCLNGGKFMISDANEYKYKKQAYLNRRKIRHDIDEENEQFKFFFLKNQYKF